MYSIITLLFQLRKLKKKSKHILGSCSLAKVGSFDDPYIINYPSYTNKLVHKDMQLLTEITKRWYDLMEELSAKKELADDKDVLELITEISPKTRGEWKIGYPDLNQWMSAWNDSLDSLISHLRKYAIIEIMGNGLIVISIMQGIISIINFIWAK